MTTEATLDIRLLDKTGDRAATLSVRRLIIAGWTGRDEEAMEKHIAELEEMGIARPASTPIFYRVAAPRLTTATAIQATGGASSGEVEFVLAKIDSEIWVGCGSDHTDREAETVGVTLSKQMCDKPIAPVFWPMAEIEDHWDDLALQSSIVTGGTREVYQQGHVTAMRPPKELVALFEAATGSSFQDGDVMFGGTLAAQGGIRPADRFEFRLHDPVLDREIAHGYDIEPLPVLG